MLFFIGAMRDEIEGIAARLERPVHSEHAGHVVYTGKLSGREIGVTDAGIGKVNAAMCTQMIIDRFNPEAIINTGIAGSLDPRLGIGDIVLSTDAVEYDMDDTAFGYRKGPIPQMEVFSFEADKGLLKTVSETASEILPDLKLLCGRVVTGDMFVNSKEKKDFLKSEFDALCCEMEGGAIAHVCHVNKVPFLIIRAISDSADDSSNTDYETFEKKAIENSIKLSTAVAGRYAGSYRP